MQLYIHDDKNNKHSTIFGTFRVLCINQTENTRQSDSSLVSVYTSFHNASTIKKCAINLLYLLEEANKSVDDATNFHYDYVLLISELNYLSSLSLIMFH